MDWARKLAKALHDAEKIAADGGDYALAHRLHKLAEPYVGAVADEDQVALLAEVAGVQRRPDDVCIVQVPEHWIEGLRAKADVPLKA